MSARPAGDQRGSATIYLLAACALVMTMAAIGMTRGLAVLVRHRAESGADLAALAAAGRIGVATDGCALAAGIAEGNGARLLSCRLALDPSGRSGTVVVAVDEVARLPLVGAVSVHATARAGRLPAASAPQSGPAR